MKNMKFKTRLIACFAIVIILTGLVAFAGINTLTTVRKKNVSNSYVQNAEMFMCALVFVAIVITLIMATSLLKDVQRNMKMLSTAATDIAAGRVDVELQKFREDEFGELVDDFQKIVDTIKYQAEVAGHLSEGDLTVDVKVKGDQDVLGNAFESIFKENNQMLSGIRDSSIQLSMGAEQVSDASQALAQGSTQQASAIEEVTASITEIAERTKRNAEEANQANESVHSMKNEAMQSDSHMKDMIGAMTEINESSENISKIIKVIDDIAFQTNILALNAAVEAARAGEAGKGFAVVAEEVRSLAAKSAAAAAETAELIEDSIVKVGAGSKIADDTAKALDIITDVVEKSEVIINGIAESSNYQTTAVVQIEQAISQVSQVVQTNSATSEECAAASEELSNQATRMRDLLSIYNTGSDSGASSFRGDSSMSSSKINMNEQIISLGDGFDKY